MGRIRARAQFAKHKAAYYLSAMTGYSGKVLFAGSNAPPPKIIRIEPAYTCNLRCKFCATIATSDDQKLNGGLMDEETFNKIVEQVAPHPEVTNCIFYVGGEPLLNKNLPDWIRRVKAETHITATGISTNGMALTEKVSQQLLDAGIGQIRISVDGLSPEENDLIRVRASYDRIRENVVRLQRMAKGTETKIQVVNGVPALRSDLEPSVKPREVPDFLARDFGKENVFVHYITKWPWLGPEANAQQLEEPVAVKRWHGNNSKLGFCTMPFIDLTFLHDGNIGMCCRDLTRNMVMGNVHEDHFLDVWRGKRYRDIRLGVASFGLMGELPPMCSNNCSVYTGEFLIREDREPTSDSYELADAIADAIADAAD